MLFWTPVIFSSFIYLFVKSWTPYRPSGHPTHTTHHPHQSVTPTASGTCCFRPFWAKIFVVPALSVPLVKVEKIMMCLLDISFAANKILPAHNHNFRAVADAVLWRVRTLRPWLDLRRRLPGLLLHSCCAPSCTELGREQCTVNKQWNES